MPRDQNPTEPGPDPAIRRAEPHLGEVDGLRFKRPRRPAHRHSIHARSIRAWLWPLLAVVVVLLVVVAVFRQPLADRLWPQTRAQALRAEAAQALAQGRLTADDGSGARELYEAALAMDPDRTEAREGLMQVAQAALGQARTAMAAGKFEQAHKALELARALSVPRAQANAVALQLRKYEVAKAGIAQLLAKASAARRQGRLDGSDDAALPLYQRVLSLQPQRIEALEGREDALADLLQQATQALDAGDLAQAAKKIATARSYDPGHGDLPDTEAALTHALEQARFDADNARRLGRLRQAAAQYRALLAINRNDAEASSGMEQVGADWAHRAERLASDFRFADADAALEQARALAPQAAATATRHVERARQLQARMGSTLPAAERQQQVARLLAAAAAAQARGALLTPPGDSAFDKLRAARAIAPDDPDVRRASDRLLPAARSCFEDALRGNDLRRAGACLDAREVLGDAGGDVAKARRRLAERWLAYGDERLGAGELQRAQGALQAARERDPAVPGLAAFAARVQAAGASGR